MDEDLLRALGERQRAAEPPERDGEQMSEDLPSELADLLAPIEGEEADALIDGALRRVEQSESGSDGDAQSGASEASPAESAANANWKGAVAVVVALAAALLLWFGLSSGGGGTLPEYRVVSLQAGPAAMRSEDDGAAAVRRTVETPADGPIDWQFSPSGTVPGAVAVALLATDARGKQRLTRPDGVQVSAAGAVRIAGPLDRFIALTPGVWTVEVIIAPADTLPGSPDEATEQRRSGAWQSIPLEVTITAR